MTIETEPSVESASRAGVQSVQRALGLLDLLASHGGQLGIGEMAVETDLPLPTIHRLLRTLGEGGYVRQLSNRRYCLGFRLISLGRAANSLVALDARPILADLVAELGETANFAVLVDDTAEYVTQVASPHSMRMFTEVGRRVNLHSTAVGKVLLAGMPSDVVSAIVRRLGLTALTPNTITTENALLAELDHVRAVGYAVDEEEQELGVRCIAAAIPGEYLAPMAISVSGPLTRITDQVLARAVPLVIAGANKLADQIRSGSVLLSN